MKSSLRLFENLATIEVKNQSFKVLTKTFKTDQTLQDAANFKVIKEEDNKRIKMKTKLTKLSTTSQTITERHQVDSILNTLKTKTKKNGEKINVSREKERIKRDKDKFISLIPTFKNDKITEMFHTNSIQYTDGWIFFRPSMCPQAAVTDSFLIKKDTGDYYCLKCNSSGCLKDLQKSYEQNKLNKK
jgi:hypothetical protein